MYFFTLIYQCTENRGVVFSFSYTPAFRHKQLSLFLTLIHSTSSPPRALTGTSFTCLCLPAITMMSCSSAMYSKLTIFLPSPIRAISVEGNHALRSEIISTMSFFCNNYLIKPGKISFKHYSYNYHHHNHTHTSMTSTIFNHPALNELLSP